MIEKGVCDFINEDLSCRGEGIYKYSRDKIDIEGIFDLKNNGNSLTDFIGFITFSVRDIIEGKNHSFLIFSQGILIADKNGGILKEREYQRDLFTFKLKTGLKQSEEVFLEEYKKMSQGKKSQYYDRFLEIEGKVESTILLEREKMMAILNREKGVGGELDLF